MLNYVIHIRVSMISVFTLLTLGLLVSVAHAAIPILTSPDISWKAGLPNRQSSATTSTAQIGATIADTGGVDIKAHGTVWKAGSSPSNTDNLLDSGATTAGVFWQNRINLVPAGSQIFFRGFATNTNNETGYSADNNFYTEPASQPTGVSIDLIDFFSMRVNWIKPADADGVLIVIRWKVPVQRYPFDGTTYIADAVYGAGDDVSSTYYNREYAVYDGAGSSVVVTNLKSSNTYHVALFAYRGSGTGASGVNYINSTPTTDNATTLTPPIQSHNEKVFPGTYQDNVTCTSNCHGSHHTTDLLPRGLAQYNKCVACHFFGGPVGASPNIGLHLSDGSVDCGMCHSLHSFKLGELYSDATAHSGGAGFNQKFIRSNMSKYLNTTDFIPPVGSPKDALANTVFQNPPGDFAFITGDTPYNGVCQTCHTETTKHTQSGFLSDGSTPADNTHQVGNNCITCHAHSSIDEYNAFKPGGHQDTDFGWNAAVDNCDVCHSANPGAPTEAVVSSIHGDNCDLCHVGGVYDKTSNGPGPAANGIDGDATLAEGAADWTPPFLSTKYICTTCHTIAGTVNAATIGGIHHDNKNNDIENIANCALRCHPSTDHSTSINDVLANCNTCHTLTQGTPTGAPVAPGDPKVHDACGTCHTLAAQPAMNGTLVPAPGTKGVQAMSGDPADCVDCHTDGSTKSGSAGMHHGSTLATGGTCQACHTNTKVDTAVAPKQLACRQCHVNIKGENGVVITSLRLSLASGASPTNLDNTLTDRAGITAAGVVTSHTIANSTPTAINDLRICLACHDGTYTNDSGVTAQAVTPFHGYPGDLAQGSIIDTGDIGGFTRKTMIGGGTMGVSEATLNTIPLIFQYYHPGHNYLRRFSTPGTAEGHSQDFAITRRSTQNSNQDNADFYRGGRGISIPTGTVATTGSTSCGSTTSTGNYRDIFDRDHKMGPNPECPTVKYGGLGAYNQLPLTAGTPDRNVVGTAGPQWEDKGYNLFFTAPYTRFNTGNKPADTTKIPYFTALAAPNDRVFVHSAEVDSSGNLLVIASNDEGCTLLTVTTQLDGTDRSTMSLNGATGYCELTVISVSPIPGSVDVTSSGTGNPSVNYPVYALVTATANNDTFGAAGSGNTVLDVLTNDTGTALQIVVSTVTGVTQTGGGGTCGTLTPTINTVTYTGGGGSANCTFDYQAQAYDGLTPYGTASNATVTVNQVP